MFGGLQLYCNEQKCKGKRIRVLEYGKKHLCFVCVCALSSGIFALRDITLSYVEKILRNKYS